MRLFISSDFSQKEAMRVWRDLARERGFEVESKWIDSPYSMDCEASTMELTIAAEEAYEDLEHSDALVADGRLIIQRRGNGGRNVELGIAIALDKYILLVGEHENIFHYLPCVQVYPTITAALDAIKATSNASRRE